MTENRPDSSAQDPWADIRPFNDEEVAGVLANLTQEPELLDALTRYRLPRLSRLMPGLSRRLASLALRRQVRGVQSIKQFQQRIAGYMERMIRTTTDEFSTAGLDRLDPATAYLFIGNHRDISLDPAFVNYALYLAGRNTVRIAIGDNLLKKPYVTDLMRLNKSFIVPRSARGKRAMLAAYQKLSGYMRHSITGDNHSIWMAQREGRAKDGIDGTDPAIIKMMTMSRRAEDRQASLGEAIRELRLVPVAISYEYDPCDVQKARELHAMHTLGKYEKGQYEDISSIVAGITGHKGRVKLTFGTPLSADFTAPDEVAAEIDRQVLEGYQLFPSHYLALETLGHAAELVDLGEVTEADRERFQTRLAQVPAELREWWLAQYANPVLNKAGRAPFTPVAAQNEPRSEAR
ncbi:1-acyl-sn-glycerol-3-phosphate acyltransferase [Halomonas sp. KAO]|uniref:1-acyl-sn-glycerol-3-phosphate acyltransferase n=1 Tax=unclassified Halomonas TaxID=2609666 RepID=UPI00189F1B34|nr:MULTISPECIES: 1-acyl-sn-glycerol-3-phosphate acyltransferase [unclassified Halomonas]MBF7052047.1 1-acyl-sn-glycerol-3-phosphate acyltransferase [Halomonas sp. KAO]MDT0499610.1 1-acyl-sn-glycerol-3-phosphate acyltransferase [Halomonas sp. PAR7]MDT0510573.1 1-acyl-sn-glycerol-3-phosphate acyltransferase [Halomonas sp. LES1]MDT0592628.1 1-acyl-sn-glycerol-3-phosphate acyltransferase [Halomonas sp. PAR8]